MRSGNNARRHLRKSDGLDQEERSLELLCNSFISSARVDHYYVSAMVPTGASCAGTRSIAPGRLVARRLYARSSSAFERGEIIVYNLTHARLKYTVCTERRAETGPNINVSKNVPGNSCAGFFVQKALLLKQMSFSLL